MAVTTDIKRMSIMDFQSLDSLPYDYDSAAAGFAADERLALIGLYSGVTPAAPIGVGRNMFDPLFTQGARAIDKSIATALTHIGPITFILNGRGSRCFVTVTNGSEAAIAFSGFQMELQSIPNGPWAISQTNWGTSSDVGAIMLWSSHILELLATNTTAGILLNPQGVFAIRFKAKFASLPATEITRKIIMRVIE